MNDLEGDVRLIEALLFASPEPVSEREIADHLAETSDVRVILKTLCEQYALRGVRPVKSGGRWSFRTAPDLADKLRIVRRKTRRLSRAATETLAIIAYHQPVTRVEIEKIRGVSLSRGTLDHLLEAGWIRIAGRRDVVGRPLIWRTTQEFLEHFGLGSVNDLPGHGELKAAGLLDDAPGVAEFDKIREESGLPEQDDDQVNE